MVKTLEAVFDGTVFHPEEPLALAPNTRVRITVETMPPTHDTPRSFLQTARSLQLEGPADWSSNLDEYLYGENGQHDG